MVEYDMTPMEAIRTSTINPARLLDMEKEIGAVAPRPCADLIAMSVGPRKDVRELERARFVMKAGVVYSAPMNGYR